MKYKNLNIIGTSHIAKQSINEVKEQIEKYKPEIVALELDQKRLYALFHKGEKSISLKNIFKVGVKGFLFSLIGAWAQKQLGKIVEVKPGSDMLTAINLAKKKNIQLALIDQDIEVTLKRLSQEITWKEKFKFIVDLLGSPFKKKAMVIGQTFIITLPNKETIKFDLTKVPEERTIKKLISEVKKRYPSIYHVLIKERNNVISKNLFNLMQNKKKILAIIGAGHEKEVLDLIKDREAITYSFSIKNK